MNCLVELRASLDDLIGIDDRPLVVFSAVWPILREMGQANAPVVEAVLDTLLDVAAARSVLMPAFSAGYQNGVCDLDMTPGSTGLLSEAFRRRPQSVRTLSAFFSFSVQGKACEEVLNLMPLDAWGGGSLYDWMEQRNARFLMLGTHPTHCSYLHRMEWLLRDRIPYRYSKSFSGTLVRAGRHISCTERLYVRSLAPKAVNDFTVLSDLLQMGGMRSIRLRGIPLAVYDTRQILDTVLPALREDPLLCVANKDDFKGHYENHCRPR